METMRMLSMAGFSISMYFLLVYKGLLNGSELILPKAVCSKNSCHDILGTGFSKALKVPNFVLGVFYYTAVFLHPLFANKEAYLMASVLASMFSLYLAHSLIYRLKMPCVLCFVSHIINFSITILLAMKI